MDQSVRGSATTEQGSSHTVSSSPSFTTDSFIFISPTGSPIFISPTASSASVAISPTSIVSHPNTTQAKNSSPVLFIGIGLASLIALGMVALLLYYILKHRSLAKKHEKTQNTSPISKESYDGGEFCISNQHHSRQLHKQQKSPQPLSLDPSLFQIQSRQLKMSTLPRLELPESSYSPLSVTFINGLASPFALSLRDDTSTCNALKLRDSMYAPPHVISAYPHTPTNCLGVNLDQPSVSLITPPDSSKLQQATPDLYWERAYYFDEDPNFDGYNGVLVPGHTGIRHSQISLQDSSNLDMAVLSSMVTVNVPINDSFANLSPRLGSIMASPSKPYLAFPLAESLETALHCSTQISSSERSTNQTPHDSNPDAAYNPKNVPSQPSPLYTPSVHQIELNPNNYDMDRSAESINSDSSSTAMPFTSTEWAASLSRMAFSHQYISTMQTTKNSATSMPFQHQNMQLNFASNDTDMNDSYTNIEHAIFTRPVSFSSKSFASSASATSNNIWFDTDSKTDSLHDSTAVFT
ncbi:hypothetical protein BATDEDRAFT_89446 [Batrachochytrium dendrobatidis JAM81]|uniref:Uncharacterized protein n=2 Tax=Batrachochytrium dendrobatidis TaxID=109871 RepID=F4P4Y4_BATDJ|nr:uncharacterized protein BATDEDRAFT_89446 [Batrachochytrium dendrobatidis JAM81]EGF79778.1 hypothetical protein BATDEDRAFT_89446 [Batrachochytrium dendrobatidis JAM81]KAK5672877.1 hypothetical protein QVD99_000364 [Batrachochytrium dendrobatidis]OAJ38985.1 hypothetical protein BDEG_22873 [Batrachochytrium dendrobatidis JEL423]|eukprot:XP_006679674.1 hypothetical protein BATDEDRAFT_89446 [Batrachochytrium dendrobatidis JAM81]